MSAEVFAQDGTLDKYIGDAVMAFWNAPLGQRDHAARACRAALKMAARERELMGEFAGHGVKTVFTRIGINTATAAVGFVGSEHLFNFTALGDGINLASRMEGANKIYGTQILVSETTAALVGGEFYLRRMDVLRVKGKSQPMAMFELMGEKTVADARLAERIAGFERAFGAYQSCRWDESEKILLELSAGFGQDAAVDALLARVRDYRRVPPPEGWDGVYVSSSK
jgi:adenylate cyclase